MGFKQFGLDNLDLLEEGRYIEAFARHLQRVVLDCIDRPADSSARTVTLKFVIQPVLEPNGNCDSVAAQLLFDSAIPKHKSKPLSLGIRQNGMLVFNPDSMDNVNQATLLEDEDD